MIRNIRMLQCTLTALHAVVNSLIAASVSEAHSNHYEVDWPNLAGITQDNAVEMTKATLRKALELLERRERKP